MNLSRVAAWAGGVESPNLGFLVDKMAEREGISVRDARIAMASSAIRLSISLNDAPPQELPEKPE